MKIHFFHLIQAVLTGMGIGFPVTLVCMGLIGGFNAVLCEFLVWMIASALFGVLTVVFLRDDCPLPFPAALALHCAGCFAVTVCAAAINGYAKGLTDLIAAIAPVFLAVYAIVYAVCFAIMKHHEKQINKALEQK